MHLGRLGQQFVLKSERAFDRLRFTGYEGASRDEWYERRAASIWTRSETGASQAICS